MLCVSYKRLPSPRCRSELIVSALVVIVPGQKKCIKKKKKVELCRLSNIALVRLHEDILLLYELTETNDTS